MFAGLPGSFTHSRFLDVTLGGSMYRYTGDDEMPPIASLRKQVHKPITKQPVRKSTPVRKPTGSRSGNAKVQPRDWRGRFASVGKKLKKIKRTLTPKYHVARMQRTRIANERSEARRQGFVVPKRRVRKRVQRPKAR
jgi:hypothetical protein